MNHKIDRRHIYGIMIDTETANTISEDGKLIMSDVLPYDIGFQLIDSHARTYGKKFSFASWIQKMQRKQRSSSQQWLDHQKSK